MVKFVAISDTHGKHWDMQIPEGDVLLHAGDFSWLGEAHELIDFNTWLKSLPHQYKVVIPGNHDIMFEENEVAARQLVSEASILIEQSITIGGIKIYGFPHTPRFHDWAFNVDRRSDKMVEIVNRIPTDTDILITHGPPYGLLDQCPQEHIAHGMVIRQWESVGCEVLQAKIWSELPSIKYHIFGHIHEGAGVEVREWKTGEPHKFINASQLDGRYRPAHSPHVFELSKGQLP